MRENPIGEFGSTGEKIKMVIVTIYIFLPCLRMILVLECVSLLKYIYAKKKLGKQSNNILSGTRKWLFFALCWMIWNVEWSRPQHTLLRDVVYIGALNEGRGRPPAFSSTSQILTWANVSLICQDRVLIKR